MKPNLVRHHIPAGVSQRGRGGRGNWTSARTPPELFLPTRTVREAVDGGVCPLVVRGRD